MKIVIIEDEKLTARDLSNTIAQIDEDVEIIALLHSVDESIQFLNEEKNIDLIFSDIQLGDGLSFTIFDQIKKQIPVIFCTAYNEYALKAFQTLGIDYILKPFSKQTVAKALDKFHTLKTKSNPYANDFTEIINALKVNFSSIKIPSVIIQKGDKIIPLGGENIALFYIKDNIVFAHTFDNISFQLSQKLDSLECSFNPIFFRANRQFLVNRKAVKDASYSFNRKIIINLHINFAEKIYVGKLKSSQFINWLSAN